MKFTIEVDCTPEELRRTMGLPDLSPIHERYMQKMQEAVENGTIGPEIVSQVMKSWAPMGDAGMDFWRTLMTGAAKSSG